MHEKRTFWFAILALNMLGLGVFTFGLFQGARLERQLDFFTPSEEPLADFFAGVMGIQLVDISPMAQGGASAYYLPSHNGHGVILVHGAQSNRTQLLPEAKFLARLGYGILSVDLPGHGGSSGTIHWGRDEKERILMAISWLKARLPACGRVGLYGFSLGSWMSLQAAVQSRQVAALVLAGSFDDPRNLFWLQGGRWGLPAYLGAIAMAWYMDYHYENSIPIQLIENYSPRPVLFLVGGHDQTTPQNLSQTLFQRAKGSKWWLLVPDAGHGGYLEAAPAVVGPALENFFQTFLMPGEKANCEGL